MSDLPPIQNNNTPFFYCALQNNIFTQMTNGQDVLDNLYGFAQEYPADGYYSYANHSNRFFRFASCLDLPVSCFTHIKIFHQPQSLIEDLYPLIKEIKSVEKNHRKKASRVDCLIGLFAKIYHWKVISYDHDISQHLMKELDIEVDYAFDIIRLGHSGTYILDTNVLLYLYDHEKDKYDFIKAVIADNSIQLIIPDCVLDEFDRKIEKRKNAQRKVKNCKQANKTRFKGNSKHRKSRYRNPWERKFQKFQKFQ